MKGFIVYATYRIHDKKPYVYLFGRLENGESFLTIHEYVPYFFVRTQDVSVVQPLTNFKIEETEFKNKKGEKLSKICVSIPKDVPILREKIEKKGIQTYEADILFERRFLIDNNLNSAMEIEGEFTKEETINRVYREPKITPTEFVPKLKILSFDLETDKRASTVYSISMICVDFKKVLIVSEKQLEHAISFKTEKHMLEFFRKKVLELDPDILTSHNVIGFDLKVLRDRFDANRIPFSFGRLPDRITLRIENAYNTYNKASSADVVGRNVFDTYILFKNQFKIKMPDYSLETISRVLLNEGKLFNGYQRAEEIEKLYKEDQQALVNYNLKDAELVLKILEKKPLIDICVQISLLTGIQPDKVKGKIVCHDSMYLKRARKRGFIAPSVGNYSKERKNKGGHVMESVPGIYENVVIFDFRSMYPSIVWTLGIDPLSYIDEKNTKIVKGKHIVAPNGAVFLNQNTIHDEIVKELIERRKKAKDEKNEAAAEAIKVLMNSILYGIFSNPNDRWFDPELKYAEAITASVKEFGDIVEAEINRYCNVDLKLPKAKVFYRDTDSFMVYLGMKDFEEAKKMQLLIRNHVNLFLSKYVAETYGRENHMFLDAKKPYMQFVMPKPRRAENGNGDDDLGIKKKYCGYYVENGNDKIDFVGMEFVHNDATELCKKVQHDAYLKFFKHENYKKVVKEYIKNLKDGKYDNMLVYRKQMSKDQSTYEKITPPHVKAARLLLARNGSINSNMIEYVMTLQNIDGKKKISSPEPVGFVKNTIDYDHYIEKQLRPAVEQLFELAGASFDELIRDKRQKALVDY